MLRKGGIGGRGCREQQNSSWDPHVTQAGLLLLMSVSPLWMMQHPTFGGRLWQGRCQVWVPTAPLLLHSSPGRILWEAGVALLSLWQRGPGSSESARCLHTCSSHGGRQGCSHLWPLHPQPHPPPPPFAGMRFGWMQFGKGGIKGGGEQGVG